MDPALAGTVVAAAAAVLGPPATWALTRRRESKATVKLTEAQAADLETQVYERVIRTQEAERKKLVARITELESQVAELKAQAAAREQELQRDLESSRGEVGALRTELASVRTQLAATQVELAAARKEAADLHLLIQVSPGQAV